MTRQKSNRGISLIETIACVVVVAAMAAGIVGVMKGSVRLATASRVTTGAPAKARQSLRQISDRLAAITTQGSDAVIRFYPNEIRYADGSRDTFQRRRSTSGDGFDLVWIRADGTQWVCVEQSASSFALTEQRVGSTLAGIRIRLVLQEPASASSRLRPDQRSADATHYVCLSPQL